MTQVLSTKLIIRTTNSVFFINHKDILFFKEDESRVIMTKVYLKSGEIKCVDKPLKYFVGELQSNPLFFCCNNSCLLNLVHLKEYYQRKEKSYLIIENNKIILTNDRTKDFIKRMNEIFYM